MAAATSDDRDDWYDFDDEEASRRSPSIRKPRTKSGVGLIVALVVGGTLLVAGMVGLILFLVLRDGSTEEMLIGTWQSTNAPIVVTLEFTRDGNLIQDMGIIKMNQKYRVINDRTIEVETQNPFAGMMKQFLPKMPPGLPNLKFDLNAPMIREQVNIEVSRNELVIMEQLGRKTFKRVR